MTLSTYEGRRMSRVTAIHMMNYAGNAVIFQRTYTRKSAPGYSQWNIGDPHSAMSNHFPSDKNHSSLPIPSLRRHSSSQPQPSGGPFESERGREPTTYP
jgi:hypothetical protein